MGDEKPKVDAVSALLDELKVAQTERGKKWQAETDDIVRAVREALPGQTFDWDARSAVWLLVSHLNGKAATVTHLEERVNQLQSAAKEIMRIALDALPTRIVAWDARAAARALADAMKVQSAVAVHLKASVDSLTASAERMRAKLADALGTDPRADLTCFLSHIRDLRSELDDLKAAVSSQKAKAEETRAALADALGSEPGADLEYLLGRARTIQTDLEERNADLGYITQAATAIVPGRAFRFFSEGRKAFDAVVVHLRQPPEAPEPAAPATVTINMDADTLAKVVAALADRGGR